MNRRKEEHVVDGFHASRERDPLFVEHFAGADFVVVEFLEQCLCSGGDGPVCVVDDGVGIGFRIFVHGDCHGYADRDNQYQHDSHDNCDLEPDRFLFCRYWARQGALLRSPAVRAILVPFTDIPCTSYTVSHTD